MALRSWSGEAGEEMTPSCAVRDTRRIRGFMLEAFLVRTFLSARRAVMSRVR